MNELALTKTICVGKSKRKVNSIELIIGPLEKISDEGWKCTTSFLAEQQDVKDITGASEFDCLMLSIAFLRQKLRCFLEDRIGLKVYDEDCDGLFEIALEDVFWVHDCLPE